ncbi:hypothetical protein [Candidatus Berkiella aquae]|uniref:Tetratricopeptide repeat protein n=1 Tax=Candidatus Berkiella aquae TaxID=295108 RepID=A0A0Q9YKB8_9GAMM|nr:hypothetical protein [Candidatus Berkiella aquae]MCS5710006.1 hypothetical protein [Candidatus Berkiella aquae]
MRQQLLMLFSQAKELFHEKKKPEQALEQFQTLNLLLAEKRGKSKLNQKVSSYIQRITDPVGYAVTQQQKHELKVLNQQRTRQSQVIKEKQLVAQKSFAQNQFAQAIEAYADLINLLSDFKHKTPTDLADAYWNLAMANISQASAIAKQNLTQALLMKEQAVLQVKQALLHYPKSAQRDILACNKKLVELKYFLNEEKQDNHSSQEIAVEVPHLKQQAPLPYHKMLLKRFLEARAEACQSLATSASDTKPGNRI